MSTIGGFLKRTVGTIAKPKVEVLVLAFVVFLIFVFRLLTANLTPRKKSSKLSSESSMLCSRKFTLSSRRISPLERASKAS